MVCLTNYILLYRLLTQLLIAQYYVTSDYDPAFEYPTVAEPERVEPYIEFDSFEGSYTSDSLYYTSGLHICVDRNNQLSGSYDEAGILEGFVESTGEGNGIPLSVAKGTFYEAGTGNYF